MCADSSTTSARGRYGTTTSCSTPAKMQLSPRSEAAAAQCGPLGGRLLRASRTRGQLAAGRMHGGLTVPGVDGRMTDDGQSCRGRVSIMIAKAEDLLSLPRDRIAVVLVDFQN